MGCQLDLSQVAGATGFLAVQMVDCTHATSHDAVLIFIYCIMPLQHHYNLLQHTVPALQPFFCWPMRLDGLQRLARAGRKEARRASLLAADGQASHLSSARRRSQPAVIAAEQARAAIAAARAAALALWASAGHRCSCADRHR